MLISLISINIQQLQKFLFGFGARYGFWQIIGIRKRGPDLIIFQKFLSAFKLFRKVKTLRLNFWKVILFDARIIIPMWYNRRH